MYLSLYLCVGVFVCMFMCVCACVCLYVCVSVCVCGSFSGCALCHLVYVLEIVFLSFCLESPIQFATFAEWETSTTCYSRCSVNCYVTNLYRSPCGSCVSVRHGVYGAEAVDADIVSEARHRLCKYAPVFCMHSALCKARGTGNTPVLVAVML